MKYSIKFLDEIDAESVEEAYDILLKYLSDCVEYQDITGFSFTDENGKES
jgi:uncharacterized protein YciU (UPF0263 family)